MDREKMAFSYGEGRDEVSTMEKNNTQPLLFAESSFYKIISSFKVFESHS